MYSRDTSAKSALVAVLSTAIIAVTATSALSMPISSGFGAGSLLHKTGIDQHRIYPGSESAAAQKARSARNAPNLFCDKQENKCE